MSHWISEIQLNTGKPRIFIGSSAEGLPVAEALQESLDHEAEVTLWSQGVFGLSHGTLQDLVQATVEFAFAILVATSDDFVSRRETQINAPRDNVIFELGLFMGALGPERTFLLCSRDEKPSLPSDLAGVTVATYGRRADGNLVAALGSASSKIKVAITRTLARPSRMKQLSAKLEAAERDILVNTKTDPVFLDKYTSLLREIDELASGLYRIAPLKELYQDDIRSMKALGSGQVLLSTCPVSTDSVEAALKQFKGKYYEASTKEHTDAARRGVLVTRVFLFKTRAFFSQLAILEQLLTLGKASLDVRVIFMDEVDLGHEVDFVVFGQTKVSVGQIDPKNGQVLSALVFIQPEKVKEYTAKFHEELVRVSHRLEELASEVREQGE